MVKNRFKKIVARSIVTLGTILAGVGIWVSILNSSQPSATVADNSSQPPVTAAVSGLEKASGLVVEVPSMTSPITPTVAPGTTVPQTGVPPAAVKPAATTPAVTAAPKPAPATTTPAKVTAPAPRLRTRGS